MGVILDDSYDPPAHREDSYHEIEELDCHWSIRFVGGKPREFNCCSAIEKITGHRLASFYEQETFRWPRGLWFQIIHPEDRADYRRAWALVGRGKRIQIEYRIIRADGCVRRLRMQVTPVESPAGFHCSGIITDITERRISKDEQVRIQAAVYEASRQWRLMFDAIDSPILILDSAGCILRVNQAASAISGNSDTGKLGQPLDQIAPYQPWSAAAEQAALALSSHLTGSREVKDPVTGKTWEITTTLFSGSGTGDQVILALRDITARKQAEEALREAEQKAIVEYDKLLDRLASLAQEFGVARDLKEIYNALHNFALVSTPCSGICISYIEHGFRIPVYACCDGKLIDISQIPPIELRETGPHNQALTTSKVIILDDFHKAYVGRKTFSVAFDVDPRMPHSSLIAPMSVMGRAVGSVEIQAIERAAFNQGHAAAMRMAANLAAVAIENVRLFEREREREEQLRQSQKMEAVGRLAGGVAHDFNNMLTAIIGYGQLLQTRLDQASPLQREVEEIQKAGQRAASLTRQLLAFSRKQVLHAKVLDLNAVVADIDNMLVRLIGEDIEMISFADPNIGCVKADPGQIEQVIMNLAINARDAMPQGGKLIIQTANVTLGEAYTGKRSLNVKPGSYVMLAVTDTGYGINKHILPHIFEPFFTTKEQGKGTGLGLSTVYGIVNQSGGDIRVDTEPGRGTTFRVYLPRVDNPAEKSQASDSRENLFAVSETILLVEDEDVVRNLVHEILKMNGYKVLQAANGLEALPICEQHAEPIHLMLTDVVMPQMGGRELAEQVAKMRPEMKVLFMSGYTDDAIVHHGVLDAGMAFIQKPFTPDSLASKVRDMLDASTRRSSTANHADQSTFADPTDTIH